MPKLRLVRMSHAAFPLRRKMSATRNSIEMRYKYNLYNPSCNPPTNPISNSPSLFLPIFTPLHNLPPPLTHPKQPRAITTTTTTTTHALPTIPPRPRPSPPHPHPRRPLRHPVPGKPDPLPIDPNNPPPRDAGPAHPRSGPSDFRPASYPGQRKPRGQGDGTPQKPRDWKPAQPGDSKPGLSYRLPARRAPTDMRSKLDTTAPPPNKLPGRDDEQAERDRAPELVAASEKWIPAPPPPPPAGLPKPVDGESCAPEECKTAAPELPSAKPPRANGPTLRVRHHRPAA
ncbi:MAG: hypothetical protein FRX48_04597 [Lasallia pustulata]|uniref:Uncharacterized protein n=1 Tax=Lasallia pustulata TaxID=136370 RepID=A0A5M8PQS0_9LECA|nr:MAG: hypothetical protein FRX48_04597 [Lasallia pustulata]